MKRLLSSSLSLFVFLAICALALPAEAATTKTVAASVSSNWSGYVASNGTYTGVGGSWTVPQSSGANGSNMSADATWIGVGGVSDRDLIQTGTQAVVQNGTVEYRAWYETLPDGETAVPLAVHAGDRITATLRETSPGTWHLTFVNATTNLRYDTDIAYDSSESSAEWIEEMPLGVTGRTASFIPLDQFGTVGFSNAFATENGRDQSPSSLNARPVVMTSGRTVLATPTQLSSDGMSFTVNRSTAQVPRVRSTARWNRSGTSVNGYTPGSTTTQSGGGWQIIIRLPVGSSSFQFTF